MDICQLGLTNFARRESGQCRYGLRRLRNAGHSRSRLLAGLGSCGPYYGWLCRGLFYIGWFPRRNARRTRICDRSPFRGAGA